ncbi:MAG: hypothetical protein RIC95_00210 [Vicingaceae bacterium]
MLQEAGLVSFLRTIVILLAIFYGARLIFRFLIPFLLKRFIKKQQNKYSAYSQSQQDRQEGEVHIKTNQKNRDEKNHLGDYVEYEEIDEQDK